MSTLSLQSVSYKNVLKDISFELEENTFNVLIGKNASGKTTLVKCIAGLLDYNGEIIYNGRFLKGKIDKDIAFVSNFNKLLEKKVIDNLINPLLNLNCTKQESKHKVYTISKKLDIDSLLFKDIDELSFNEKKLILLASALVTSPKIIVIDNFLDGMDLISKEKIIKYLKKSLNLTILLLTLNKEDILYADSVLFLDNGQIIKEKFEDAIKDEKNFLKVNSELPFMAELSFKLKSYELIDDVTLNIDEMVGKIWD